MGQGMVFFIPKGDPLSPALFILGAEVSSRSLNALHFNQMYEGFQMEVKGPQINHLSFADDIIIFASTDRDSLQLIMNTLAVYEEVSDQLVSKGNSHFMITSNTPPDTMEMLHSVTGFSKKDSSISYLGCPLYIGRQRIIYYSELVDKVIKKINGW